VPTGNVIQYAYNETVIGGTMLGWESFSNGNISSLIPSATASGGSPIIYTLNQTDGALNDWDYTYFSGGVWANSGVTLFQAGRGYYINRFKYPENITYERNPH